METPYDRLRIIVDDERLEVLRSATVMVLGLGGVGSSCVEGLARGGIGHLVLIDRDKVMPSNINRQIVATHSALGRMKCDVMRDRVLDINPDCEVTSLPEFIEKDRVAEQLDPLPEPDYVVDAIDTISQKLAIAQWCSDRGYPEICSSGAANKLDPTRFAFADISDTRSDPICRVMRKECRKRGIDHLEVLYTDEPPMRVPIPEGTPRRPDGRPADRGSVLGTVSYMPPVMGLMIAGRVIRALTGLENRQGLSRGDG